MLKSIVTALVALLFVATVAVGFSPPGGVSVPPIFPIQDDEEVTIEDEQEPEDEDGDEDGDEGDGPPDLTFVQELVESNVAHAAARAAAARAHAAGILEWTACIAANAANPGDEPRDDSFDPKVGCEDLRPDPPTDPNDPEDEVDADAGPPDGLGAPDGAGPPDWVPGPPPGAGPGGGDEAEGGDEGG